MKNRETKKKKLRWILITGQSGAGKEVTKAAMREYFSQKGVAVLEITNSTEMNKFMETDTYSAKKMKEMNDQTKYQPAPMIESLYFERMRREATEHGIILQDGSPRRVREFEDMLEMEAYYGLPLVVEVLSSDELCEQRLFERTEKDKRSDLSKDGQPGIPDPVKIARKMRWWTEQGPPIVQAVKEAGCYESIDNKNGTMEELREKVFELLDQYELP